MAIETITIRPEPLVPAIGSAVAATGQSAISPAVQNAMGAPQSFESMLSTPRMIQAGRYHGRGGGNDLPGDADGTFEFADLIDIINPLQHIPVISTLYREITGDTIKPEFKVAGGGLFGGIVGVLSSVADAIIQGETGKDIGQNMLALLEGDTAPQARQVASAAKDAAQAKAPVALPRVALAPVPQSPLMPGFGAASPVQMPQVSAEDKQVMALFGGSSASAHASYEKANMLGYLTDVSTSNVL